MPRYFIEFGPLDIISTFVLLLLLIVLYVWWFRRRHNRWETQVQYLAQQNDLVFEKLPDGLLLTNLNGQILRYNNKASSLLRLNPNFPQLELGFVNIIKQVAQSKKPVQYETQTLEKKRLQIRIFSIDELDQFNNEVICVLRDVSQQRYEESVSKRILQNISHEFLTPLTAMVGNVANLKEITTGQLEYNNSLTLLEQQLERLQKLATNLLLLSKLQSEFSLNLKVENIGIIVEGAVGAMFEMVEEQRFDIKLEGTTRLPRIKADFHHLQQVFVNLLENALKYCPQGTKIHIMLQHVGNEIVIKFSDNGPGIPTDDLLHIFEVGHRVRNRGTRAVDGSGLGLAIVREIIDQHKGQITVDSAPGKGTTFTIRLPTI